MRTSRTFRVIFGIFVLILFSYYSYCRYTTSPHSDDFPAEAVVYSEVVARIEEIGAEAYAEEFARKYGIDPETTEAVSLEAPPAETAVVPEETPAPVTETAVPDAESDLPQIDINSWEYILVNDTHRLTGADFPPQVVTVSDSQCPVDSRIAEPLMQMAQDCIAAGYPAFLSSGYRSYAEQSQNFIRVCNNNGVSDGKDANGFYITMPAGASEHQTGLCCDITDYYRQIKNAELENTDTFKWLNEHCTDYGFILRFPKDKQEITGVMYEPFHFRYVGVEVAKYMTENNLCLEEFVALYQTGEAAPAGESAA